MRLLLVEADAMIASAVQRHGVTIELDDAPGGGLRVRVSFPR